MAPGAPESGLHPVEYGLPALERRGGRILITVRDRSLYRHLGYVRLGDYVVEKLGVSLRTAQEWMRVETALSSLPATSAAFDSGRITPAHLRLLTRIATPATEAFWVAQASRRTVRDFAEIVSGLSRVEEGAAAVTGDGSPSEIRAFDELAREGGETGRLPESEFNPGGPSPASELEMSVDGAERVSDQQGSVFSSTDLAGNESARSGDECSSPGLAARAVSSSGSPQCEPPHAHESSGFDSEVGRQGRPSSVESAGLETNPQMARLEIDCPAWMARLWRDTVPFIRRLLGRPAPQGECLEVILAEFAGREAGARAACGAEKSAATFQTDLHASAPCNPASTNTAASLASLYNELQRSVLATSLQSDLATPSRLSSPAADLHASAPACESRRVSAGSDEIDARAANAELRALMTLRQRGEAALAAHLRRVGAGQGYRSEGIASLEAYARERFGLCARRLYYLLKIHSILDRLPALRTAFTRGKVTLKQALLIGDMATGRTAAAWIRRARSVTLRRLEDEAEFLKHLSDVRPGVYESLESRPLPAGIALAPGVEPRLHASASPRARAFIETLAAEEARVLLPAHRVVIRMLVEPGVNEMWVEAGERATVLLERALEPWEVLAAALYHFWSVWDNEETRRQRRDNPVLERDGWRCLAPGCRSEGSGRLQAHHVVFRSEGGGDDHSNMATLCSGHHIGLLHRGLMKVRGAAPDALRWEMGIGADGSAFKRFHGDAAA